MALMYPVVLQPLPEEDGGGWLAEIPDLPGCMSDGVTPEEALKAVQEAQEAWLAVARERGVEIPPSVDDGRRAVVLRLPEEVYRQLAMRAFGENRAHRVAEVAADVIATAVSAAGGGGNGVDVLHVYGQDFWHQDAYLVGGRKALKKLRAAIERALAEGRAACQTFTNDGEGYDLHVVRVDDAETLDRLALPYRARYARKARRKTIRPHQLVAGASQ